MLATTARACLPSIVTLAGLALSIVWVMGGPAVCAFLALLADVLDGWLARRLGAVSRFGGALDWHADCAVAAVVACWISPWLLLVVAPVQAASVALGRRLSLRTSLIVVVTLLERAAV